MAEIHDRNAELASLTSQRLADSPEVQPCSSVSHVDLARMTHTVSLGLLRGALGAYGSSFLLAPVPVPTACTSF